jgi:hypothetical protein
MDTMKTKILSTNLSGMMLAKGGAMVDGKGKSGAYSLKECPQTKQLQAILLDLQAQLQVVTTSKGRVLL